MSAARARWRGRLLLLAFRLGIAASRWAPAPLADAVCRLAGWLSFLLAAGARRHVLANLCRVLPQTSEAERRRTARRAFYHVARNYYDLVRLRWLSLADVEREVRMEGRERLMAAAAAGRGVIAVAPHLGNFSVVPHYGHLLGLSITIVMEPLDPPELYDLVAGLRAGHGVRLVPAGAAGLRQALAALRRGEVLVLVGDRDITGTGVTVPFFGAPARLPAGPAALALRTGATLLPLSTYREAPDRSVIAVQEPVEPVRTSDREADIVATTARLAAALETAIARAPEQWVVLQSVWR